MRYLILEFSEHGTLVDEAVVGQIKTRLPGLKGTTNQTAVVSVERRKVRFTSDIEEEAKEAKRLAIRILRAQNKPIRGSCPNELAGHFERSECLKWKDVLDVKECLLIIFSNKKLSVIFREM